jgi:hypothetical protein
VALSVSCGARLVTGDADLMDADLDRPALNPRALLELLGRWSASGPVPSPKAGLSSTGRCRGGAEDHLS